MIEKPIKISCTNTILKKKPVNSFMWRLWRVQINPIHRDIHSSLGSYIDHVEYILHESFETPRIGKIYAKK